MTWVDSRIYFRIRMGSLEQPTWSVQIHSAILEKSEYTLLYFEEGSDTSVLSAMIDLNGFVGLDKDWG